ncbi:MAG: hypothetical protein ACP5U1_04290 [Desulfomonilaceae bacterium]
MPSRKLFWYIAALVGFVNLISLLPLIHSPYLGDDSWCESTLPGLLMLSKMSLADLCWNTVKDYVHSGRWYPLIIYYYPVFCFLNEYLYKTAALLFVLTNIGLFAYFVRLVTSSTSLGLMSALLPPLFIQFRCYHDPVMSYYFLMQIEFTLILLSLICLNFYLRKERLTYLILSLVSWGCCLLVYEAFYAFWLMHALVAYLHFGKRSIKRIVKIAGPFFLLAVLNMMITLYVRNEFAPRYPGINLNFSVTAWLMAFFKQAVAAFPLSYFLSTESFNYWVQVAKAYFATDLVIICAAWAILWCLVSDRFFASKETSNRPNIKALGLLGFGFWILPAILVTLSTKYQQELKWGLGYLPVYVSGFGMIMLTVCLIAWIYQSAQRFSKHAQTASIIALTFFGVVVSGLNYNNNRLVIQKYNFGEHFHRNLIEDALHANLLHPAPEGSYMICGTPVRSWDTPAFYRMHSGLTLQVVQLAGFSPDRELGNLSVKDAFSNYLKKGYLDRYNFANCNNPYKQFTGYKAQFVGVEGPVLQRVVASTPARFDRQVFFLRYEAKYKDLGYAILSRLTEMQANNEKISGVAADKVWVYVAIPVGYPYESISFSGSWIDKTSLLPTGTFRFTDKEIQEISSDANGKLFELPASTNQKYMDPKSLTIDLTVTDNASSRFTRVFTRKDASFKIR